jgi:hypothetical protein
MDDAATDEGSEFEIIARLFAPLADPTGARGLVDVIGRGHNERSPCGHVEIWPRPLVCVATVASCVSCDFEPHRHWRREWIAIRAEPDYFASQYARDCGRIGLHVSATFIGIVNRSHGAAYVHVARCLITLAGFD